MRTFLRSLIYIAAVVCLLVFVLLGRIDRTPLADQPFYHNMMRELDTLSLPTGAKGLLKIAWGKYNITPDYEMPMAGYKPRDRFDAVHDSLYARIIAIDNGAPVFIISADLLIFPPALKKQIESDLKKVLPNAFVYFTATHTHNGLGGWDNSLAGRFIAGDYHEEWVHQTSEGILQTISSIQKQMKYGVVSYLEADATGYAGNRLAGENGKTDSKLRALKFVREDSTSAILVTFSAHATSISRKIRSLSGDYPAVLERELEKRGYDFAIFAAGMVGSHRLEGFNEEDFELTEVAGEKLAGKILAPTSEARPADSISITTAHIPVQYGPSQLRLEQNLRVRDWAFQALLGGLEGEITVLEMGDVILLGTSCDFSGELSVVNQLDSLAALKGKRLIITSFNGNYTGYITLDDHYDQYKKEEVMAMNWVGPYYGQYYTEIIAKILSKD